MVLVLLLAAFLGLLTAVVVRAMRLPGAIAPTVLVMSWIVVPPLLRAIPSAATQYFASDAALTAPDAVALAVAVLAAAVTLGVQAERCGEDSWGAPGGAEQPRYPPLPRGEAGV